MAAPDVAAIVQAAIDGRSGFVALYEHSGQSSARVLYPASCRKSKGGALSVWAWDSLRQEWRSFRLDRIHAAHPLRGPPISQ